MRVVDWLYQRWQATGLSARELAARSGVRERTLFRLATLAGPVERPGD